MSCVRRLRPVLEEHGRHGPTLNLYMHKGLPGGLEDGCAASPFQVDRRAQGRAIGWRHPEHRLRRSLEAEIGVDQHSDPRKRQSKRHPAQSKAINLRAY